MYSLSLFSSSASSIISLDSRLRSSLTCRAINNFNPTRYEMKAEANFYRVLSLDSDAAVGAEEIKKAYRGMAMSCHPDVCADPSRKEECTRRFIELQRAYKTLSDPCSRRRYGTELKRGEEGRQRPPEFSSEVWEAQLCELNRRSDLRARARVN